MASLGFNDAVKFRDVLEKHILSLIDKEMLALSNGYAADFADYKERVGKIDGLRLAILEADAVLNGETI